MTKNYGATKLTCKKYFLEELGTELISSLSKEEKSILDKLFDSFYNFIHTQNSIFANPTSLIAKKLKEVDYSITLLDGSKVQFSYFKSKIRQINYISRCGIRVTKNTRILTDDLDKHKIRIASTANYVQTIDAAIARFIILFLPRPSIHDCFLVTPFEVNSLICLLNEAMNLNFYDLKIYTPETNFTSFSVFVAV